MHERGFDMSVWLVRGGKAGEHEPRFLEDNRIYLNWEELQGDLSQLKTWEAVKEALRGQYVDAGEHRLGNWTGQIDAFLNRMKTGDLVVLPLKQSWGAIAIGEIAGDCVHLAANNVPYRNARAVSWWKTDFPRAQLDVDLQSSLGALLTICELRSANAEQRFRALGKGAVPPPKPAEQRPPQSDMVAEDLERRGLDDIARHIEKNYKGHEFASLIDAILQAQGFATHFSPPGPDGGVDILAGSGPLGFGSPSICVQVKSGSTPVDRPTLDQLIGAMQNHGGDQGLLVSWGGFKDSVRREKARQFFKVRLWGADDVIRQLIHAYDRLPEKIRAELPLRRIWTVAEQEE
jgi:restriction system protein